MKRDIVIDADHILFLVAYSNDYTGGLKAIEDENSNDEWGIDAKIDLETYKRHFKAILNDYILTAEVESICYNWDIGKIRVILSDWTNFRYDIYPQYKSKRDEKSGVLKKLKKWAMKKYTVVKNTEADDVVAYYVRNGGLGFTTDKDLLKGVSGIWFNSHYRHRNWNRTSKIQAEKFFMMQALAGDPVDEIPAIKGIGLPTAKKLLDKRGYNWNTVLDIYIEKGYTKEYAQMNIRLVCMNQWSPKKGIKLWNLKKNTKN